MRFLATALGAALLMMSGVAQAEEAENPYAGDYAEPNAFMETGESNGAASPRFMFSQGFGTLGSETQAMMRLSPSLDLRGSFSFLSLDRTADIDAIAYQGAFESAALGAFVDWRPLNEWLTLSAGLYFGDRGVSLSATPGGVTQIGAISYTPAEIGTLRGAVDLGEVAPYLGVAADMKYADDSPWGLRFAAGLIFNDVTTRLSAVGGLLESDPAFQAEIESERAELQDAADALKVYPVVSIQLTYRR